MLTTSGASLSYSFLLSFTIVDFTLATLTVLGNALLLMTTLLNPLRCLRTPTTYLIANLAFSDLFMGFVIGYSSAVRGCFMYQDKTPPYWMHAVVNVGGGTTLVSVIWTVIAMAVDRYMAVTDPLRYSKRKTARRVLIFIVLSWAIAFTVPVSFYSLARQSWTIVLLVSSHTHFTIPVFVLLFAYVRIFQSLASRRRELVRLATSISNMTLRHTLESERKMAFTMLTILILFCASFLPLYEKFSF